MKLKLLLLILGLSVNLPQIKAQTDDCASAPFTPVIATCVNFNYSLPASFVNSSNPSTIPSCGSSANRDGWYRFLGNGSNATINVTNTNRDMDVAVYTGSCGALVEVACQSTGNSATPASITIPTTAATTYWVRIIRTDGGGGAMDGTICVVTAPLNDECSGAQSLVQNTTCTLTSSSIANATQSLPGCVGTANNDVWFQFTATSSDPYITVSNAGFDVVLELFDACSGNSLACQDTPEEIRASGLTVGNTYFVRVYSYFNSAPSSPNFDICVWDGTGGVNNCYAASTTTFNFENSASHTNVTMSDDEFTPVIPLGFNFCFMGSTYGSLVISANGLISFDLSLANGYSDWQTQAIPTTDATALNAVMGPWHDIDPSVGGNIRYATLGTAPNRRFVVTFLNVPNFDCTGQLNSQQIKLFETTNEIEIHVLNRLICTTWDGGEAVLGLNGPNGVTGIAAPGRNDVAWAANSEAWLFSCGASSPCTILSSALVEVHSDCQMQMPHLQWSVNDESEVSRFLIQAMDENSQVETIEEALPSGYRKDRNHFEWSGTHNQSTWKYYRLVSQDINGDYKYSEWQENFCRNSQPELWVQNGQVHVMFPDATGKGTVQIWDLTGKEVGIWNIVNEQKKQSFSLPKLTPGIYLYEIKSDKGIFVKKLLIASD